MAQRSIGFFKWNQLYAVGIIDVDREHQRLIYLLNELANQIVSQNELFKINGAFDELINYAKFHFKNEEKVWNISLPKNYAVIQHAKEHRNLLEEIKQLKLNFSAIPKEARIEKSLEELSGWLVTHMVTGDLYMATLLAGIKSGMSIEDAQCHATAKIEWESKVLLEITLDTHKSLSETTQHLLEARYQLEASESRLQDALTYAKIGHWELSDRGNSVYWSDQMYQLLGLSKELPAGPETLLAIMDKNYHTAFHKSLEASWVLGREHSIRYPISRPSDGERRWIDCKGKVIYKDDGEPEKISGFIQDITEYRDKEELNRKLAATDPLTGLFNRRGFEEIVLSEFKTWKRHNDNVTVMILDLDHFKQVNDQFGHQHGDEVLKHFTKTSQKLLRENDIFFRSGGEEFVLVLRHTAMEQGKLVAERIRSTIETEIVVHSGIETKFTVSIGVSEIKITDDNIDSALQRADEALYQAKALGRNRVETR